MQTHFKPQTFFAGTLQAQAGELMQRVTTSAPGAERSRLLRWLLVGGALFMLWRVGRSVKKLFWALFGVGMALYWSGALWWLSR